MPHPAMSFQGAFIRGTLLFILGGVLLGATLILFTVSARALLLGEELIRYFLVGLFVGLIWLGLTSIKR